MKAQTLFIAGGNEIGSYHKAMVNTIRADIFYSNFSKGYYTNPVERIYNTLKSAVKLPKGYDFYFAETIYIVPTLSRRLRRISSKIINLMADPILYDLRFKETHTLFDKINAMFIKDIDAFVMAGDWTWLLKELDITVPSIPTKHGPPDSLANNLMQIDLEKQKEDHSIIFVGGLFEGRLKYKGLDLLFEAIKNLRSKYPNIKLYATADSNPTNEDISLLGFKKPSEGMVESFKNKALAVNMGRGDTYPISTIETMQAGIPTIVSEHTGTKPIISKADKSFVLPLDATVLAQKIDAYFSLTNESRKKLRYKFREAAKDQVESKLLPDFKKDYNKLIEGL